MQANSEILKLTVERFCYACVKRTIISLLESFQYSRLMLQSVIVRLGAAFQVAAPLDQFFTKAGGHPSQCVVILPVLQQGGGYGDEAPFGCGHQCQPFIMQGFSGKGRAASTSSRRKAQAAPCTTLA